MSPTSARPPLGLLLLDQPSHLFLLLQDLRVKAVTVLADRVLGVVRNGEHIDPPRRRLVGRVVELGHVRMPQGLVRRQALARVEDQELPAGWEGEGF